MPEYIEYAPTEWQFVGSYGDAGKCSKDSKWNVLCEDLSGKRISSRGETVSCEVPDKLTKSYQCLGINVLKLSTKAGLLLIKSVKMWKRSECKGI